MFDIRNNAGFSLTKFTVVLIVIGLGIGFLLTHKSTYHSKIILTGITELDKLEQARLNFEMKYGYLPGDMPAALAMQLRFAARNGAGGRGDGNSIVEGITYPTSQVSGTVQTGEPFFFWEDLYTSAMIGEPFHTAIDSEPGKDIIENVDDYLPDAHLRKGDYIYVYSDKQVNYYGISSIVRIDGEIGNIISRPGFSVREAYDLDRKVDDGNPSTGKVLARYLNGGVQDSLHTPKPTPASCSDSESDGYTLSQNNGEGINCGLSFTFTEY